MRAFRLSTRSAAALVLLAAAASPGAVALAAGAAGTNAVVAQFDARAQASPGAYCVDIPQVLVGQKICGGMIQSSITATTDPRGFALAGLAPVPKLSSVPLLVPQTVPVAGLPVPKEVQDAIKQVKYDNTPTQCQALFPVLAAGDGDRTCGGPTAGDAPLGFIASGANAHVQSSGDADVVTATHTIAESRAADVRTPGLQSTGKGVYALAEGGLNDDGVPTSVADVRQDEITLVSGLVTIQGIRSRTIVSFDGTKAGTSAKTTFSYRRASVVGIPVDITPNGLVVSTNSVPAPQVKALTAQLNTLLKNNGGLGIELLPAPPIKADDSQVSASSGGILVTYTSKDPTEVTYSQLIGHTQASVGAVPLDGADGGSDGGTDGGLDGGGAIGGDPGIDTGSGGGDGGIGGGSGGVAIPPGLDGGSTPGEVVDGGSGPDPSLAPEGGSGSGGGTGQSLGNPRAISGFTPVSLMSANQLRNLYPAFCLLLLGSLVASRIRRRPVFERHEPAGLRG
jgi:hypothetical protein